MKKIFIVFAFLLSVFNAFADGLSANDITLKNDDTANLDINLENASPDIVGLQFNLNLSEGITPVMEGDKVVITPSDRLRGSYSLRGKKLADGSYLFTFLSNDRTPIEGNSGTLFSITLQNSASLADGNYRAVISDVTITDLYGNEQRSTNSSSSIAVVHSYKLTYYVDGAKYKELSYDYGAVITPEAEPAKEGYTFSGWSEIPATMPAHDVEVNGSFTINKYTIKFVNEDGTVLQSSEMEYGATPVYSGATPSKSATAEYSYTFAGWTPEIVIVTADATYTATYTSVTNQYKLTYKVDGTIYKEYTLNYGAGITPEAEPTKEGYTFSGWSEIPSTMPAHDVEVTGTFTKCAYKLTYYIDGAKYKEVSYDFGDSITPEAEPTRDGYTFSGWSEIPLTMPAHDVEVNGSFTINKYIIKFVNEDGTVLQSSEVEYGVTPVYSGATPSKSATAEYSYTFAGWTPEIIIVTADATYTATYTSTTNQYKLTYKVDGAVYKEYTLNYGAIIAPEAEPAREGYTFSGWSEIPATMPAHDVTVNGSFTINKYKVTFISDGTIIKEDMLEYGAQITAPVNPTKVGHTFTGWNPGVDATVPAHDVTYTAQFSANQYTITFDTDGGSAVAPITLSYGTAITKPADPVKQGYTFAGWNPAIPETMPAENMTIKALWTINSYKLTYKVDGNVYKEYSLAFGVAITPEAEPTKEGYTFSGWSEIPQTMPAHDVTVNGSFTINKYKVTFISDGTVIKEDMLEYGATIAAPANPTKVGHTFTGWNPAVDATVPAHDVTYTAQFSANQYTITFDTDGGSAVAPITLSYGTAITKPADPVKQGYTFAGWNPAIPETMPAENMTIKALWTINSYKLTYKVDGNVYKEYSLAFGAAITPEAEPTKEGYTFSGWSDIPQTMPAYDVVVTGSFTKGAYKLTYYVDGAKYKELSYDFGDSITPEAEPTKEGYTFSGWSEIPSTMPAHDVEVNGSFTINKYTIKFVNEDGTVLQSSEVEYGVTPVYSGATPSKSATAEYSYTFAGWTPEIVAVTADATYTVTYTSTPNKYKLTYKVDGAVYKEYTLNYGATIAPEAEPAREGYTFSGWSEIPSTMPAHDVEVTGSFTKGAYKLTYYVDGAKYKEVSYDYGDAITPEAEPTREGYTFSGWSEIPQTMPAYDVVVNGSFEVNIYKVSYFVDEELVHQDEVAFGETFELWTYVPEDEDLTFNGWIGEMYETMPAHNISYIADITSGIAYIISNPENVQGIYTLDGKKVENVHQGVYVIRMKDGSTRKFIAK